MAGAFTIMFTYVSVHYNVATMHCEYSDISSTTVCLSFEILTAYIAKH